MVEMHRFWFLCIFSILGVFFCIWQHVQFFKLASFLSVQEKKLKKSKEVEREMLIQFAKLSSLERIERIARKKFGLILGSSKQIIFYNNKTVAQQNSLFSQSTNIHALERRSMNVQEKALKNVKKVVIPKTFQMKKLIPKQLIPQGFLGPHFLQFADASHLHNSKMKKSA